MFEFSRIQLLSITPDLADTVRHQVRIMLVIPKPEVMTRRRTPPQHSVLILVCAACAARQTADRTERVWPEGRITLLT